MTIRTLRPGQKLPSKNRLKADQHWDMAGLARQDGDTVASKKHTDLALEYEQKVREENT